MTAKKRVTRVPSASKRLVSVHLRFTAEEEVRALAEAAKTQRSLSGWVRWKCFGQEEEKS